MRQYAYLSQFGHPYFKKAIVWSIGFHIVVLGLTIIFPMIPWLKGMRSAKYSTAVRVDLVELPSEALHKVDQNLISTRDAIRSLKKQAKETFHDPDALKFSTKKAIREQRQKSAIEQLKSLRGQEKKELQTKVETLRRGNIKSEGADVSSAPSEQVLDSYRSLIYERVKLRWSLPSYLRSQKRLSGEIIIFLNPDGTILRTQIVSSGNREYDEYMNRAVEESLPLPEVPKELSRIMRYDGMSLMFHPGDLK